MYKVHIYNFEKVQDAEDIKEEYNTFIFELNQIRHDAVKIWGRISTKESEVKQLEAEIVNLDTKISQHYENEQKIKDNEQIIRSLLHEHTHSRQNKKIFDKGYEEGKTYQNHPYERAAVASERKWKKYLEYTND